ncbi:sensor histidine kinase [uncultured Cellulomonas sp.]|uniref:sensor histidine kinase n=1 Tax=uncultured Cellulomonas sp. TaxID=189682 RepID=UPI002620E3AB|nr:histidine kinase [uncultured Cellulomonas sp.]
MTSAAPRVPTAPERASARFRAGLAVLAVVVLVGTWGADHGAARGAAWRGAPWRDGTPRFDLLPPVPRPLDAGGLLLALVPVAALLLVRRPGRAGGLGAAAAVAALAGYLLAGYPFGPVFLPVVVAVVLAAATGRRVLAWATAAGLAAALVAALAVRDALGATPLLFVVPWLAVLLLAGEGLRVRRERQVTARAAQAAQLESLVATERLGIARDLHDVLAHSLSAIHVQAGVGLHLLDSDPGQARASLQAVKDTSKVALDEVRGVIGALRRDGDVPRAPAPDLTDLPRLLDDVRASGVAVTAHGVAALHGTDEGAGAGYPRSDDASDAAGAARTATGPTVPRPVGAAAYRIVQESLTNVRRHASRPEADVTVTIDTGDLRVTVRSPRGTDRPAGAVPGHGITGMRERVESLGGRFDVGPGGEWFVVSAVLPLRPVAPGAPGGPPAPSTSTGPPPDGRSTR